MYRSVTESQDTRTQKRRTLHWMEGVCVGVAVFLVVFLLFGWG